MTKSLNKLAFIVVAALAASTALSGPAQALDPNPLPDSQRQIVWNQWRWPDIPQNGGSFAGTVYQGMDFLGGINYIASEPGISVWPQGASYGIPCAQDLACITADGQNVTANGMMPLCSDSVHAPCVEGLEYSVDAGEFQPATFMYAADTRPSDADIAAYHGGSDVPYSPQPVRTWSDSLLRGVPASATGPLVFDLPGAPNAAGATTYALTNQFIYTGTSSSSGVNGQMQTFEVNFRPVLIDGSKSTRTILVHGTRLGGYQGQATFNTGYFGDKDAVAFGDKASVGFAAGFSASLSVRLSIQLPNSLGGWLQGRAESPNVSISPIDSATNRVVLQAKPTVVPITGTDFDVYSAANAAYSNYFDPSGYQQFKSAAAGGMFINRYWAPNDGTGAFQVLAPLLGTKAKGQASVWNFSNLRSYSYCMSDNSSLQGLLTTNAMTYQSELPTFDSGSINYKVAGLHFDSSGEVFKGTYNFIMRDSVAKCLYGFKGTAPMQGTVSVTSSDGQENVAYTNVTDRDGWLSLTALGFTFSNPVISAKLTQAPDPTPVVTPSPSLTATPPATGGNTNSSGGASGKKTSITCVKGKVSKKVTGSAPKCPAGYKKKA